MPRNPFGLIGGDRFTHSRHR